MQQRRECASVARVLAMAGIVLVGVLAIGATGQAQPSRTTQGLFLRNATAIRYNPLGLFDELRVGYRKRLFQSDESMFLNTFVSVGANVSLSPAFGRGGLAVELQPLSILNFTAIYEAGGNFGSFGLAQSWPSAGNANFSDSALAAQRDQTAPIQGPRNYATWSHQLQLGGTFQIKLGPIIARTNNRFVYQQIGIRTGDRVFYDQYWDILFPNGGWIYVNDIDVLLEPITNFRIGVRYNYTHAFYRSDHFSTGAQEPEWIRSEVNDSTQRIGPILAYTFFEHRHGIFNAPTLAVVVNWWLQHPYRAGPPAGVSSTDPRYSSQLLPYLAMAFSFRFDP